MCRLFLTAKCLLGARQWRAPDLTITSPFFPHMLRFLLQVQLFRRFILKLLQLLLQNQLLLDRRQEVQDAKLFPQKFAPVKQKFELCINALAVPFGLMAVEGADALKIQALAIKKKV